MESYAIAAASEGPGESFYRRIAELATAKVDWIQLRAKTLQDSDVFEIARTMRGMIGGPTRFVINGRADIAAGVGADGVHLPVRGVPASAVREVSRDFKVGRSCHTLEECRRAAEEQVDYLVLGPVFPPRSKRGEGIVTLEQLGQAARLPVPVFALGGFTRENMKNVKDIPIAGIAGVTLFMSDGPIQEIVDEVRQL
jgi:thiamine-phosphate pyrophosphorylase